MTRVEIPDLAKRAEKGIIEEPPRLIVAGKTIYKSALLPEKAIYKGAFPKERAEAETIYKAFLKERAEAKTIYKLHNNSAMSSSSTAEVKP